jgi:hypothetical protein
MEFCSLPQAAQVKTLVRLANELTILARESYDHASLGIKEPDRLRAINELQHRITSHALALLAHDAGRYPEEVIGSMILANDDPELERQVEAAFARSIGRQAAIGS